ncbi:MAG: hypothetical protein RBU37_07880 [Myxococcota bacterium]|nr:hypothetical protein [Myxococcota bacterium]
MDGEESCKPEELRAGCEQQVGGTGQAPNGQEVGGTGQAPNGQEVGRAGRAPNGQEVGRTGRAPNRQEVVAQDPAWGRLSSLPTAASGEARPGWMQNTERASGRSPLLVNSAHHL